MTLSRPSLERRSATVACAAVREPDVIRAALGLGRGLLRLPRMPDAPLALVPLRELGAPGPYHLDIKSTGNTVTRTIRHRGLNPG